MSGNDPISASRMGTVRSKSILFFDHPSWLVISSITRPATWGVQRGCKASRSQASSHRHDNRSRTLHRKPRPIHTRGLKLGNLISCVKNYKGPSPSSYQLSTHTVSKGDGICHPPQTPRLTIWPCGSPCHSPCVEGWVFYVDQGLDGDSRRLSIRFRRFVRFHES